MKVYTVNDGVMLTLIYRPSFKGELRIDLIRDESCRVSQGNVKSKFLLSCKQSLPIYQDDPPIEAGDEDSLTWDVSVSTNDALEILALLDDTTIPPIPKSPMGLDGCTYELIISRGFGMAHYVWWGAPYEEWKVLGEVAASVLSLAQSGASYYL